jgi:hypothetical protein
MFRRRWPIVLGALAVLFAGLTNAHAHVHLCFDGQEPPASVHTHGTHGERTHHAFDETDGHDDRDVDLESQALAKSLKPDLPLALLAIVALLPPTADGTAMAIAAAGEIAGADPPFLRPPLRAPPAPV